MNFAAELAKSHPQGSVDKLNTFALQRSNDVLGIPVIQKESRLPDVLIPHKTRLNHQLSLDDEPFETAVHFFLEDYRFESVWHTPRKGASYRAYRRAET